jgi:multicomponent Na+:H+ antiporter subunit E
MNPVARRLAQAGRAVRFAVWFTGQFLRANVVVAREILTPGQQIAPAVVELELRCSTPLEIATMIGLVTLTPGTLALALPRDRYG